jgi:Bacterial SH3 domain
MKQRSNRSQPVVLVAIALSLLGGVTARATEIPATRITENPTQFQVGKLWQLAQGLAGQCRQANGHVFIYRDRSSIEPIRALAADERVVLAENAGRGGWIAINAPVTGFVETRYLKSCSSATATPSPVSPPPVPPSVPIANRPSSLCRQVIYAGPEGMAIRSGPSVNFARVAGVAYGDRVAINPSLTRLDSQGREWLRVTSPTVGWISNGFPSFGEMNLSGCL